MEGDCRIPQSDTTDAYFNPRPPHGGRHHTHAPLHVTTHFNPRPPHGGRATVHPKSYTVKYIIFQSTPSIRRTTFHTRTPALPSSNFNPRPPHGGRPHVALYLQYRSFFCCFSIFLFHLFVFFLDFLGGVFLKPNTETIFIYRVLHDFIPILWCRYSGGHDSTSFFTISHIARERGSVVYFNPSPSAWRATANWTQVDAHIDFNPRPPHGGRRREYNMRQVTLDISIHALRMEGDAVTRNPIASLCPFQSTPSAWRATRCPVRCPSGREYFNPRPPHGGRQVDFSGNVSMSGFQSTPSAWRATSDNELRRVREVIFQSTPSAWRATAASDSIRSRSRHFNPRPPHGGRHISALICVLAFAFQSTPSAWRATFRNSSI